MRSLWAALGVSVTLTILFFSPVRSVAETSAADAVEAAVVEGYVEGIHREQDVDKIRRGLHEAFVMSILRDGEIAQVTRDEWIGRIESRKAEPGDPGPKPTIDYEFTLLDRSGDAAVAKIDLHRDGKHVYTDYMSLYRFEDGWKIVGKIFEAHD